VQPDLSEKITLPITDRRFLDKVFSVVAKARKAAQIKDSDNLKRVCAEEYEDISRRLDITGIQESCSVRNVLRTRRLANLLINDKGELITALLPKVISHITAHLYSLGPQRNYDSVRQEHVLMVLNLLTTNKELVRLLQSVSKPHSHPQAEQIIRNTLQLPHGNAIQDAHARRAVLSAWLCYLRQNVGSCFATAPAIIIQNEQPELFLTDLKDLINTGRLKRTFGGIEYVVPLSSSWGAGDLRKPFLLPAWEEMDNVGIWNSPGLLLAFEAAGLLNKDETLEQRKAALKEIIYAKVKEKDRGHTAILTTPEEIIRWALMKNLGLFPDDLEAYDNRPKGMIHTSLIMQLPIGAASGMGGKGEACLAFYQRFESASNAFKGLSDNALLKAWEFSLASFSETKAEFTRWNLYSSLGLGPNEAGGIGECLYKIIKHRLDYNNQKMGEIQLEYDMIFSQLKQLEQRIRHAGSERDAQWIRADYQTKLNEFYTLEEMRDKAHSKSARLANMFDVLINAYDNLFPKYFQEVYDADMHEVQSGPYDDSPAGFRLMYKHGRDNTSQWTKIRNPQEFIDDLASFFTATERELTNSDEFAGFETDLSEIVTNIVSHIRTKEFLETAFHRMARAHNTPMIKDPLENLEKIEKKPWAYTSGGTINTLISCYFKRETKPTEVSRWVENPMELLVFFADTLKQIPYKQTEEFRQDPKKSMLMHSPTHAFNLRPGLSPFKDAWQTEAFTYTWIRDYLVKPMEKFIDAIELDAEAMDYIVEILNESVPTNYRHYFRKTFSNLHGKLPPNSFRDYLVDTIRSERGLHYAGQPVLSSEEIDGAFFSMLPLFPTYQLKDKVLAIFSMLPGLPLDAKQKAELLIDKFSSSRNTSTLMCAQGLQNACLALLCLIFERTTTSFDYHKEIAKAAQKLGYAMPVPIIFADTNWVKDNFAFIVSPGTGSFELWRMDADGRIGRPMSSWRQWLNGSRKDIPWGLYTKTYEYRW
jgi:hypothetical protein